MYALHTNDFPTYSIKLFTWLWDGIQKFKSAFDIKNLVTKIIVFQIIFIFTIVSIVLTPLLLCLLVVTNFQLKKIHKEISVNLYGKSFNEASFEDLTFLLADVVSFKIYQTKLDELINELGYTGRKILNFLILNNLNKVFNICTAVRNKIEAQMQLSVEDCFDNDNDFIAYQKAMSVFNDVWNEEDSLEDKKLVYSLRKKIVSKDLNKC